MTGTKIPEQTDDAQLRFAALIYYAVLIAGFVVGLYGLISLLSLATHEVERSAHLLGLLL
ncbi:MAG TPA: hypothetical protein VFB82_02895 [Blastocatellia bacterium]|nr:hypothetical protein [Blastocatellia bacterium]